MPASARREIDRVLSEVREQKRPGYIPPSTDVARFPTEPPVPRCPATPAAPAPARCRRSSTTATALIADHSSPWSRLVGPSLTGGQKPSVTGGRRGAARHVDVGKEPARRELINFLGIYAGRPAPSRCAPRLKRPWFWSTPELVFTDWSAASSASGSTRPGPSISGSPKQRGR